MKRGRLIIKRLTPFIFLAVLLLAGRDTRIAYAENEVALHFFWGNGCPHCNSEKLFLEQLKQKYPQIEIKSYEVWYNIENAGLFAQMAQAYRKKLEGVPTLFIGDFEPIVGYLSEEVTGKIIEEKVKDCIEHGCINPIEKLRKPPEQKEVSKPEISKPMETYTPEKATESEKVRKKEKTTEEVIAQKKEEVSVDERKIIHLPLLGQVDTSKTSLPVLTIIIAGLDGFNPCAFFVLFLLLSILIYAHSRKTMLLIGGTFVFFSGFIYFLFMSAWLNLFLLFGQLMIITVVAGLVALIIAAINIKDFFFFEKGVSLVIPEKAKPKLFERTRNLLKKSSLPSMMFGTVVLAIAANTYELLCTAGFPMVYTRALTLHNLPTLHYYLYLVFYNMIYVIPLAVIVLVFSLTLGARKLTEWQGQVLKLISGLMMLCLGLVLLIKPDLLNNVFVSAGLLAVSISTAGIIIFTTKMLKKSKND